MHVEWMIDAAEGCWCEMFVCRLFYDALSVTRLYSVDNGVKSER
jgi:hypothetical protein